MAATDPTPDNPPTPTALPLLLTAEEVAQALRVPLSWVYDAAEDGRLPRLKLGRHLRFRADTLAQFLDDLAS